MDKVKQRGRRNILKGKVISDKMDKTISVLIYNSVKHPKYEKYIKKTSIFKVHDEKNSAKPGDTVRIFETRALSKTKRWMLLDIDQAQGWKEDKGLDLDVKLLQKEKNKQNEELKTSTNQENLKENKEE